MIQWNEHSTEILLNPRLPSSDANALRSRLKTFNLSKHVWLTTSGSTGKYKCVALSKQALLISADSVNKSFDINDQDVWILALPEFHVGGLGVRARAYLSGAKLIKVVSWNAHEFYRCALHESATASALVPAQMYDIVMCQYKAPSRYRFTFIGGGVMTRELLEKSSELGWNPIPTYGMTESSSQIAVMKKGSDDYYPLSHATLRVGSDQRIAIKSEALLTAYAIPSKKGVAWIDPKVNGWYTSDDLGSMRKGALTILGRGADTIKINGETVNVALLRSAIEESRQSLNFSNSVAIVPVVDSRSGYQIHLVIEGPSLDAASLVQVFNKKVMPYEKIKKVHFVEKFPRSSIGKILIHQLSLGSVQ